VRDYAAPPLAALAPSLSYLLDDRLDDRFPRDGLRFDSARAAAIGPRSLFGVLASRRSLPACDATFLEVGIKNLLCLSIEHSCTNMFCSE
jgi:hypothetical protein